jgi:hypothetical protein
MYTSYEQAVIGMIAHNPYLFHYILWEYRFPNAFLIYARFIRKATRA